MGRSLKDLSDLRLWVTEDEKQLRKSDDKDEKTMKKVAEVKS